MPVTALSVVLAALATYRFTLLVISDALTEPPREAVIKRAYRRQAKRMNMTLEQLAGAEGVVQADRAHDGWKKIVADDDHPPKLAYLITCPWCSSFWLAWPIAAGAVWAPTEWWFQAPAGALAFSAAAGFLAHFASS